LIEFHSLHRHKFTLFLALDGNFRLNQIAKQSDPDDVPLNKGNAYFVNADQYRQFLERYDDSSTHVSNINPPLIMLPLPEPHFKDSMCSKLKAVRQQQMVKFTNTLFSGVVATQCARHNFYLAQGMVNLVKGETYARLSHF